ncbi:hypothetical protein OAF98_05455, partial [Planctomicrobium sp.]|nr:hypothetical protein [Planctomicrobium sp.]
MFNTLLHITFVGFLAMTSAVGAEDGQNFVLPVSASGEQIHDRELLTRMDGVVPVNKKKLPISEVLPASKIVEQKRQKFQKLQEQFQELNLLWEQMRQKQADSASQSHHKIESESIDSPQPPIIEEPTIPTEPQGLEATKTFEHETTIDPIEKVLKNTELMNPGSKDTVRSGEDVVPEEIDTHQNVSGPVDRFALATSLYAVGHFNESLQAIDSIQLKDLTTHETIWLDYLRAGCHRELGAAA